MKVCTFPKIKRDEQTDSRMARLFSLYSLHTGSTQGVPMKRNGIVLLMSALMLLSAAVYIAGCSSQPVSNSSQNQGNQDSQTGIEGVWKVKKYGSYTLPMTQNGSTLHQYYSIKNGKIITAVKIGKILQKIFEHSYTLSGNTMTLTMPDGQPQRIVTYSISGSSLKMTLTDDTLIKCIRVTSPTAQEIESAPQAQN